MTRIVVYTALFGNYDTVAPAYPGSSSLLFTDQYATFDNLPMIVLFDGWTAMRVEPPHPDPRFASRWYFDQSTKAVPEADYTLMHGANGQLQMAPEEVVELLPPNIDIAVFRHPHRASVYDEAEACIRMRKDDPVIIQRQMESYRREGFPGDELSTCIFMIRRNTPDVVEFEAFWWNEVVNNSCRDQLSFDYTRWKTGIPVHYLEVPRISVLKVRKHKANDGANSR